ncbi:type I-B CRISPR-associated endonuclease Cas1b [Ruminiclostridium sufflavum]|nr:type I-B CRISPR-associated endonuclease Cas1b [Ruminiclostridium sufflavum]
MSEQARYIFSKGGLSRKDFSIQFRGDRGINYIPIADTRELYCFEDITISTKLLNLLANSGVLIHFFDYFGHYTGTFYPKNHLVSGSLTIKQCKAFTEDRMVIAKAFVSGIAANIYFLMYHYYRHGKKELKEYIDWLRADIPKLLGKQINIKQLLMIEGTIWARFYQTFKVFLPEDFVLNKRVKRPPDNPINALISFGNSLLYAKTLTQIYHTHLDPAISFLHEPGESRFSLSLDLCEVFKPAVVYKTIFDCVNNRKLNVSKHFSKELNYCILNEQGRKIFIKAFEDRMNQVFNHPVLKRKVSYKTAVKLDAYKLIKFITEGKEFSAFNMEACK